MVSITLSEIHLRNFFLLTGLVPLAVLSGCQTIEVRQSMFIRPDVANKAMPLPEQAFDNGTALEVARPDGALLRGVLVTRPGAERTLLYFGGNMFHLDESGKRVVAALGSCKINVAIFDYRGYGRSSGIPTVDNMRGDALAIYDLLASRFPGNVAVHGQSLGSFVAAGVAQERPVRSVALLRLVFWMFPPLNYALALSPVGLRDYVVGSALGLVLPLAVMAALFGSLFG